MLYDYCLITPTYETCAPLPLAHAHVILKPCELGVLALHYVLLMSLQKCFVCVSLRPNIKLPLSRESELSSGRPLGTLLIWVKFFFFKAFLLSTTGNGNAGVKSRDGEAESAPFQNKVLGLF